MSISRDDVRHIARLARLLLDEAEIDAMARDLGGILDYVARLEQVDTSGAGDEDGPGMERSALRPDRAEPGLSPEEAVGPAPVRENSLFKVPPAFGEG